MNDDPERVAIQNEPRNERTPQEHIAAADAKLVLLRADAAEGKTPAKDRIRDATSPDPPPVIIGGCFELANRMADVSYVLEPVLVQRQLIALTGRTGHGKSTVALAMAFALALQRNLGPLTPQRSGLVYFVSAEDADGTRKRMFGEGVRWNLSADERNNLNKRLRWVHVTEKRSPMLIAEDIRKDSNDEGIACIFLDTGVALFAGEDENDNTEMHAFAISCRRLTELNGDPCVVVFWHPVKNATEDNLAPRGGSAFLGAIDGNLTLWLEHDHAATLAHGKWRADHFERMDFNLETVRLIMPSGKDASAKIAIPVTAAETEQTQSEVANRREKILVAMFVAADLLPLRALAEKISDVHHTTIRRDLVDMASGNPPLVELDALSKRYALTRKGRTKAEALHAKEAAAYRAQKEGE